MPKAPFLNVSELCLLSAVYPTPLGYLHIQYNPEHVFSLKIFSSRLLPSVPSALTDDAAQQILEYLQGRRITFSFPFQFTGSSFQADVWNRILRVPYGNTASYKDLAFSLGRPSAVRAVASACGQNPLWIVVPCHRIIGSDGKLHGYAGGLELKQKLLNLEQHTYS